MIIGSGLIFLALYAKRHPTVVSGPFRVFVIFACITILNCISLINLRSRFTWIVILPILAYVSVSGSFAIYFNKHLTWHRFKEFVSNLRCIIPNNFIRLCVLIFANLVNIAFTFYTLVTGFSAGTAQDFPSFVL